MHKWEGVTYLGSNMLGSFPKAKAFIYLFLAHVEI